jgi:hypothetical protein
VKPLDILGLRRLTALWREADHFTFGFDPRALAENRSVAERLSAHGFSRSAQGHRGAPERSLRDASPYLLILEISLPSFPLRFQPPARKNSFARIEHHPISAAAASTQTRMARKAEM